MKRSAGILLYRALGELEVLLVHPGGPFWKNRDTGAWSIPKGEYTSNEDPIAAARREFREELGSDAPTTLYNLGTVRYKSGKEVTCFTAPGCFDVSEITSNTISVQWPPKSGQMIEIPEVDRAEWFDLELARSKILPAQAALLDRLQKRLAV